jgi:hypothetical protein
MVGQRHRRNRSIGCNPPSKAAGRFETLPHLSQVLQGWGSVAALLRDANTIHHRVRGSPTFEIAATMETSLEQLSKTYGHLLPDSAERARVALDAFNSEPLVPQSCPRVPTKDARTPG